MKCLKEQQARLLPVVVQFNAEGICFGTQLIVDPNLRTFSAEW